MAQHVHKIVYDHIQIIPEQVMDIVHEILSGLIIQDLGIGMFDSILTETLQLQTEQFFLMKVFASFFLIIFP